MQNTSRKPRFIKPPNKLKLKVGAGGLDEKLLDKAQEVIRKNAIDFKPIGAPLLADLMGAINALNQANMGAERIKAQDELANAIMQLKANGGMFRYQLISEIAALALHFLESAPDINADAMRVIDVHAQTIRVIMANGLKGDGGQEGYALVKELEGACNRYFKKYAG